jgi:hypothetical protein
MAWPTGKYINIICCENLLIIFLEKISLLKFLDLTADLSGLRVGLDEGDDGVGAQAHLPPLALGRDPKDPFFRPGLRNNEP